MAEDENQNNNGSNENSESDDFKSATEDEYSDDLKSAKNQTKKQQDENNNGEEKESAKTGIIPEKKRTVGIVGKIIFVLLLAFAILIDLLSIITADLSSIIGWIFDIAFGFGVFIFIALATGDIMKSLYGRRNVINVFQTIVEIIPIINLLPIHFAALLVIYFDVEYDILGKITQGKIGPTKT